MPSVGARAERFVHLGLHPRSLRKRIGTATSTLLGCALILPCSAPVASQAAPKDTVTVLLGLTAATIPHLFIDPPAPELQESVETFFDDASRCDGKRDCVESIDSPYEAYSLASYLFLNWNDHLRQPIRREDLTKHREEQILPLSQEKPAIEHLQAEKRGELLRRNAEEFRQSFWRSHLEKNRAAILSSLERFEALHPEAREPRRIMILGAGSCADIPLEELARRFEVILVDIDGPSMDIARARLPEELRPHVTVEVRDLSGGTVLRHSGEFRDIIAASHGSTDAMNRLADRMEAADVPTPLLEGEHRVQALVSSMLVSQIPYYLVMQIVEALSDPSVGLEGQGWTPRFAAAVRDYSSRFDDAHAEALRDFCVRSGGFVYYSSDLCLKRSVLELGEADEPLPELEGVTIQSIWHHDTPITDLSALFRSDPRIEILQSFEPWIWEHFHPVLQQHWSALRKERLCAPMREDSCWTAGPRRFKVGRRFLVDAVAFTRR